MKIETAIEAALRNVALHGDTDIFPFPFENLIFSDRVSESRAVLENIHADYSKWLSTYPPQTITTLTQVGYTGFRWATMIDPFWNAYYLALVISDFNSCFQNLLSDQPLTGRQKVVGTTNPRFGWCSSVYGSGAGRLVIWIIGGSATPTAWNTAPAHPPAAARRRSLRPAWSMSV